MSQDNAAASTRTTLPAYPLLSAAQLLDQPPLTAVELDRIAELCAVVFETTNDVILFQAEAILALEAVARSVASAGTVAVNIVTGPYGGGFGEWMREAGADVTDIVSDFDDVADPQAVASTIREIKPSVVALVHAEAATGGTNDVSTIFAAAKEVGAVTILDSVAAIGAEPVHAAEWGADIVVLGGQKALAGPAGVSAVAVSDHAWALIDANENAPRSSSLSLIDWRDHWLRTDRSIIPGLPSWLEGRALLAALERVVAEGVGAVNRRHVAAAAATRAGVRALGLELWQKGAGVAPIATTIRVPQGDAAAALLTLDTGLVTQGNGSLRGQLLRVNHYGRAASLPSVIEAVQTLADALGVDALAAVAAARAAWL